MADDHFDGQRRDLEIEVGHGVPVDLRSLVSVSQKFSALIDEVASEYTGVRHPIRWIVEVEPGSVRLPLRAETTGERVRPSAAHEVGTVVASGLSQLEQSATRPDHFNDKALEQAKALAALVSDELPLAVRNGTAGVNMTRQLSVNAEKVLGVPRETFGTIEGRLEALNVHGSSSEFSVWPLEGKAVKCIFGERLDLDKDIFPAVKKRVAVRGRIKTRPNGERLSVDVDALDVLPEPVSADEVRGILKGYEVADW